MSKKALVTDADNVLFRWFANIAKYNKENNLPYTLMCGHTFCKVCWINIEKE